MKQLFRYEVKGNDLNHLRPFQKGSLNHIKILPKKEEGIEKSLLRKGNGRQRDIRLKMADKRSIIRGYAEIYRGLDRC